MSKDFADLSSLGLGLDSSIDSFMMGGSGLKAIGISSFTISKFTSVEKLGIGD